MTITSMDGNRIVSVGTSDVLHALYSTIMVCLREHLEEIPEVISFLEERICEPTEALQTARQFNRTRDLLSNIPPERAVYDMHDPSADGPWTHNLSGVVTSCANLFTTSDGQDLLFEIVSILSYAGYCNVRIIIQ